MSIIDTAEAVGSLDSSEQGRLEAVAQ